jgi:UDP-glucose:tetrahydrobiopterin glucosyltransferase
MRIGLLAPLVAPLRDPQLGGAQVLLCDLAAALAARGHEVEVVAASGSSVTGLHLVDSGVDAAALGAALFDCRRGSRADAATERAHLRAYAAARRRDYAVLHNHAFDVAAVRHAVAAGCAVVHTLHLPPDAAIAAALAEARASAPAPLVACVSTGQARAWSAHTTVDAVLRNGVPVAAIGWERRPGRRALFAGRLSPEKGADDAVRIALRAGLPIDVVGGAYDPEFAERCRARWATHPSVRFHGAVSRRRLWHGLAGARVLIVPSRWEEPFGLVAAEAQAAGTPVVAHRVGGLGEIVADGRTGFLVEPGDAAAAAAAVAGVSRISRAGCRRHAERHLDIAVTAAEHERFYLQALGAGGGAAPAHLRPPPGGLVTPGAASAVPPPPECRASS